MSLFLDDMYNRQTGSSGPGMQPAGNTGNTKPPSAEFSAYGGGYGKCTFIIIFFNLNKINQCLLSSILLLLLLSHS